MKETIRQPLTIPFHEEVGWSRALWPPIGTMGLGAILALWNPLLGALVMLAGFGWVLIRSIPIALATFIIMAPIPLKVVIHGHKLYASDIMAILLMVEVLHQLWQAAPKLGDVLRKAWELFFPSVYRWALVFLLGLSVLSLPTALSHVGTVIKILEYVEFFVVVIGIARFTGLNAGVWKLYLFALVASASVLSLYGFGQFLVGAGPLSNQISVFHVRADAVFGQPNPFGGFNADLFPMVAALVAIGPRDLPKRWLTAGLVIITIGVISSYSRGAWVSDMGAVFFMGVLAYATRGKRVLAPLVPYAVAIPVLVFGFVDLAGKMDLKPLYHHLVGASTPSAAPLRHAIRVQVSKLTAQHHEHRIGVLAHANPLTKVLSIFEVLLHPHKYYDVQQRFIIWGSALQAFVHHPLVGVGLGNFHLYIQHHRPKHLVGRIPPMAHDLFLEWGADLGVGGFIAGIWLEWRWLTSGVKAVRKSLAEMDSFWYAWTLGAFGTVIAFILQNLIDLLIDHGVIIPFLLAVSLITLVMAHHQDETLV